jgi:dolichol kinase
VLLPKAPAIAALWCVTAGDPAAALFGTWRTSASPTSPGKTLGGTVACAVISIAGVWSLGGYAVSSAVVIGVVAALAERFNGPIDDNALIAAAAGVAALVV